MKSHRAQAREQATAAQESADRDTGELVAIKRTLRALVSRTKKSEARIRKLEADVAALRTRGDS